MKDVLLSLEYAVEEPDEYEVLEDEEIIDEDIEYEVIDEEISLEEQEDI